MLRGPQGYCEIDLYSVSGGREQADTATRGREAPWTIHVNGQELVTLPAPPTS